MRAVLRTGMAMIRITASTRVAAMAVAITLISLGPVPHALAGPTYDHDRKELESILEDLIAWLPGGWSSAPHVHYDQTVKMPAEGEHENWYRTFARIDAPQIGPYVLYGQINIGGRDGPLYQRSQILCKVSIDEARGTVSGTAAKFKARDSLLGSRRDPPFELHAVLADVRPALSDQ